jgi:opacity protein-like surface antigen
VTRNDVARLLNFERHGAYPEQVGREMIINKTLALLLIAFLVGGSAIKAQAEAGFEDDSQAKRATPPAGSALIYIFRDENPPVEATVPVVLDGRRIGQTRPRTFLLATVAPGTHYLISGDKVIATLSVDCTAGKTYFISQKAIAGVYPVRTDLAMANSESARRTIAQSRLATAPPTAPPPKPAAAAATKPAAAAVAAAAPKPTPAPKPAPAAVPAPTPAPKPTPAAPVAPAPSSPGSSSVSKPASASEKKSGGLALILKTGSFEMSNRSQVIGGLESEFDSSASGVVGAELEWRDRSGFAFGGEMYRFTNNIVAVGTPLQGEMEVVALMANAKKYFEITGLLYPYVGAGLGVAATSFSGDLTGSASGQAYQAMAGIEFRSKNIGLYTELKYLSSSTEDSNGAKVKVGGNGLNIGLGISFGF